MIDINTLILFLLSHVVEARNRCSLSHLSLEVNKEINVTYYRETAMCNFLHY